MTGMPQTNNASVRPVRAGLCGTSIPGLRFASPRAFTVRRVAAWIAEMSAGESGSASWIVTAGSDLHGTRRRGYVLGNKGRWRSSTEKSRFPPT